MGHAATPATVRGTDGRTYAFGYKGVKHVEAGEVPSSMHLFKSVKMETGYLYDVTSSEEPRATFVYIALGGGQIIEIEPGSFEVSNLPI